MNLLEKATPDYVTVSIKFEDVEAYIKERMKKTFDIDFEVSLDYKMDGCRVQLLPELKKEDLTDDELASLLRYSIDPDDILHSSPQIEEFIVDDLNASSIQGVDFDEGQTLLMVDFVYEDYLSLAKK